MLPMHKIKHNKLNKLINLFSLSDSVIFLDVLFR